MDLVGIYGAMALTTPDNGRKVDFTDKEFTSTAKVRLLLANLKKVNLLGEIKQKYFFRFF